MSTTIGALRVILGLDSAQFEGGLTAAQKHLQKVGRQFERLGAQMSNLGQSLTIGLSAPLVAMGASALKASANFETAMTRVSISTKASAKDMAALEVAARQIGKSTVFSASEAADAMDMLAKTGLDTTTILNGAAKAAVDLAAAAGSELEPAASAISDSLRQFKLNASQLPGVVNQITGAVNESKLDFADFTLAIGQAGGVAAGLGVSFEDFNAVLAGTSSLFASGSDAGTSFKTFLTTLVPKTKEAAGLMKQYGLEFFDANGAMKSMTDIAEMLRQRLGGLSDEAKTNVLKEIFGTDAMRTAIGLMDQGADGLNRIKIAIGETDAAAQAAKRMTGFAGQMEQLKGAFEDLGIAIGKSGLLEFMTTAVAGLTGLLDRASELNPELLKFATIAGAVVAAVGPLAMIAGGAATAFGALMGILAAPITLPIVAAVAAVGVAFAVFGDEIIPALKVFGAALQNFVGPKIAPLFEALGGLVSSLGEAFDAALGGEGKASLALATLGVTIARALGASLDVVTGAVNAITSIFEGLAALLRGDFAGAWTHAGEAIWAAMSGIGQAFQTLFPEVVRWVKATVEGVKTWFGGRFTEIMNSVRDKVKLVGDAFFDLYDRVVGHSYVPDMVEGVAAWMAKLDAGMVKPARTATKATAAAFEDLRDQVAGIMDGLLTDAERKIRDYDRQVMVLRKALKAGVIDVQAMDAALAQLNARDIRAVKPKLFDDEGLTKPWEAARQGFDDHLERQEDAFADSLARMADVGAGFFQDWIADGKADWKRLLLDLTRDWQSTMSVLTRMGGGLGSLLSKGVGALGGAISGLAMGQGVGLGTGNGKADMGLALGGSLLGGAFAGTTMATTLASAVGSSLTGALGAGLASGLTGVLASAAFLGPVGAIAGLALGSLFKKKPSNNGALATFTGDSFGLSGDKRTDETSQMATAAAQAILEGQKLLAQAGATLTATVRSIDIGTRDATDIILSNGQALTSGVGDAAAAAETALKAMLAGATFADAAQESLAKSMLAAGKGFDEILAGLGQYSSAQGVPKAIADAILKFTDPKAAEVGALEASQAARRAEIEALGKAGYLSAQQLDGLTAQLAMLEGLELDDVLSRFADATDSSLDKVADVQRDFVERLRGISAKLQDLGRSLRSGPMAMLSPSDQYEAAKAEFRRTRAAALTGDTKAAEALPDAIQAFAEASRDFYGSSPAFFADMDEARAAVSATASLTDGLLSEAEAQLDVLEKLAEGQGKETDATIAVRESVERLTATMAGLSLAAGKSLGANPVANAALVAGTGYTGEFGQGGFQAWIVQQDEAIQAKAREILTAFGQTNRINGFATGGSFQVGGFGGTDSQLMQFMATPGEMVDIRRPGQIASADELVELRAVRRELQSVNKQLEADKVQRAAIARESFAKQDRQLGEARALKRVNRTAGAK